MRRTIMQIALVAVIVLAGFLFLFKRDAVMSLFRSGYAAARGYTPAQTPDEALTKFRDAIKARDYNTAASYCGPEYGEQMRKAAKAAQALAEEIDNLNSIVEKKDFNSEKVRWVLSYLEPFPPDFKVVEVKKKSDDLAIAIIDPENTVLKDTNQAAFWQNTLDPRIMRSLAKGLTNDVELKREGDGKEKSWKIFFPVTPDLRITVEHLNDKYKEYVKVLETLKFQVRNEPMTHDDMENRLKNELSTLKQRHTPSR
jgi:hypothetical protein